MRAAWAARVMPMASLTLVNVTRRPCRHRCLGDYLDLLAVIGRCFVDTHDLPRIVAVASRADRTAMIIVKPGSS